MRAIFRLFILVLFVSLTACGSGSSGGKASTSPGDPVPEPEPEPEPVAFPGAEGFGAVSTGGRGGQVIEVTNLNSSGSGSLRACVDASGARTCVFRVGGTIDLSGNKLEITNPFLTIAGQTAPGGGITIKGAGVKIATHDVIVRYIRIRLGPLSGKDAFGISDFSSRVIVDHASISWGSDETASVDTSSTDSTIQWTIISEGLNFEDHGYGSLISSGSRRISFHHNLWAHFVERLPKLKGKGALQGEDAVYDFANNVVYNWKNYATAVAGSGMANVVKNYFKLGPNADSFPGTREIRVFQETPGIGLYVEGNIGPSCPNGCSDEWDAVTGNESYRLNQPINVPPVTTTSAIQARDDVLAGAGDNARLNCLGQWKPNSDSVDTRVINEVIDGAGSIINNPSDVGGWPVLAAGTACSDSDADGMPDAWETLNGFNPSDSSDGPADADGDGYTNLEEFLNGTTP